MKKYLVETKHKKSECFFVMKDFAVHGHIVHFEWGCENGVCTGWAFIEADSKGEALLSVPGLVRNSTKVIEVKKLSPDRFQSFK